MEGVYPIRNHWKGNTQEIAWDAELQFAGLRGPADFKLLGGRGAAIAIRIAALVEVMDRRNGATSATRTEHDGVANRTPE